eukprot:3806418-Pleurochrysis_carterae.AAC.2
MEAAVARVAEQNEVLALARAADDAVVALLRLALHPSQLETREEKWRGGSERVCFWLRGVAQGTLIRGSRRWYGRGRRAGASLEMTVHDEVRGENAEGEQRRKRVAGGGFA